MHVTEDDSLRSKLDASTASKGALLFPQLLFAGGLVFTCVRLGWLATVFVVVGAVCLLVVLVVGYRVMHRRRFRDRGSSWQLAASAVVNGVDGRGATGRAFFGTRSLHWEPSGKGRTLRTAFSVDYVDLERIEIARKPLGSCAIYLQAPGVGLVRLLCDLRESRAVSVLRTAGLPV
jgi:hypothetical protein